ncbi:MAG TPA: DUF6807 family protein [Phycisphaerae bacterium]|nr:DUF6807 family protein [Phycisphaerae bacterium]
MRSAHFLPRIVQLRRDHGIMTLLAHAALAGSLWLAVSGCASPPRGQPWQAAADPDGITFQADDRQVLRYRFDHVPFKPYVEWLRTPAGTNVLLDAPADHLHHHGLMYAVAVEGIDFWGETPNDGRQSPRYLQILTPTTVQGLYRTGLLQTLDWIGPADKGIVLQEKRTIEVWRSADLDASLVSWQSELHTPPGKNSVELTGRKYFGLGMRFIHSMDIDGRFFNADKGKGVAGTDNTASRWCAYTAQADGCPVTVAIFSHMSNPRHPATWFTMTTPFAYLSVTANLHHEPIRLTKGQPLRFRYAVALWDGTIEHNNIESLYRRWAGLPPSS